MPHNKKKSAFELEQMIKDLNEQVEGLAGKLAEDVKFARKIQASIIPERFPLVPGFCVRHKYLSGLKSGGDYIDFFEFNDKTHIGIMISDSSGYGLSAAFMSILLGLAMKLSPDEVRSPAKTLKKIHEALKITMKPKEELSIFYGVINRKTFNMRYTGFGNIHFIHNASDISINPAALKLTSDFEFVENEVLLQPGERLVLMSDGFFEAFESGDLLLSAVKTHHQEDPLSFINECAYQIKRNFSEDDMPNQDCSVMVIDVEKRAIRLAS